MKVTSAKRFGFLKRCRKYIFHEVKLFLYHLQIKSFWFIETLKEDRTLTVSREFSVCDVKFNKFQNDFLPNRNHFIMHQMRKFMNVVEEKLSTSNGNNFWYTKMMQKKSNFSYFPYC